MEEIDDSRMYLLFMAIAEVESSYRPTAVNKATQAYGLVQIRQCVVSDVNEWMKLHGSSIRYSHSDAFQPDKSYAMFVMYLNRWANDASDQYMARVWYGRPKGATKDSTLGYWAKVQRVLDRFKADYKAYERQREKLFKSLPASTTRSILRMESRGEAADRLARQTRQSFADKIEKKVKR